MEEDFLHELLNMEIPYPHHDLGAKQITDEHNQQIGWPFIGDFATRDDAGKAEINKVPQNMVRSRGANMRIIFAIFSLFQSFCNYSWKPCN